MVVDVSLDEGGKGVDGCSGSSQGDGASQISCNGGRDRQLTKEKLGLVFAEENPHKQFELFTRQLWSADSARMSTQDKTIAEYDFLNVIFCREQHFTTEQTIAIRGITLSVFEATIVRGELDLDGAFEAFTERVLSLAEVPETGPTCGGGGGNNTGSRAASPVGGGSGANSREIESSGPTGPPPEGEGINGGGGGDVGEGGGGGAVFSVGDIDAITRFVARGLYRNFSLYRMCFKQEERCCREFRQVQVETPLRLAPLHEAEPA